MSRRFDSSGSRATSTSMLCAVTICGREPPSKLASATSRASIVGTSDHFSETGPLSDSSRPVARITAFWMRGFQSFGLKVAMKMPIPAIGRTTNRPITITRILRQRMEDLPPSCPQLRRAAAAPRSPASRACSPCAAASLPAPSAALPPDAAGARKCGGPTFPRPPSRHPGPRGRRREWARPACARKNRS